MAFDAASIAVRGPADDGFGPINHLAPYLDESEALRSIIYGRSRFARIKYLSHAYRFNGRPVTYILHGLVSVIRTSDGFIPLSGAYHPPSPALEATPPLLEQPPGWFIRPPLVELLEATVCQIREAGIPVVLFTSPRWRSDFHVPPDSAEVFSRVAVIAQRLKVPFVQINQETATEFHDPGLFSDASHLNADGAKRFSGVLGKKILELGVLEEDAARRQAGQGR